MRSRSRIAARVKYDLIGDTSGRYIEREAGCHPKYHIPQAPGLPPIFAMGPLSFFEQSTRARCLDRAKRVCAVETGFASRDPRGEQHGSRLAIRKLRHGSRAASLVRAGRRWTRRGCWEANGGTTGHAAWASGRGRQGRQAARGAQTTQQESPNESSCARAREARHQRQGRLPRRVRVDERAPGYPDTPEHPGTRALPRAREQRNRHTQAGTCLSTGETPSKARSGPVPRSATRACRAGHRHTASRASSPLHCCTAAWPLCSGVSGATDTERRFPEQTRKRFPDPRSVCLWTRPQPAIRVLSPRLAPTARRPRSTARRPDSEEYLTAPLGPCFHSSCSTRHTTQHTTRG